MHQNGNKVMDLSEAISKYVNDGDMMFLPWGSPGAPVGAIHEIIRQDKRDLTLISIGNSDYTDPLFYGKQVKRVIASWIGSELLGLAQIFRRRVEQGKVEIEDYINFHIGMMLWGGKANVPFVAVPVQTGGDILKQKGFMGEKKYAIVECPFTGKKTVIMPTFQPDVGILHVQRCDREGYAQAWGAHVDYKTEIHLACKKLIITTEEIVDDDIITHDPDRTIVPANKVCAVVEEPWSGHPKAMYGFYDDDLAYRVYYEQSTYDDEKAKAWLDEWVFGVKNRQEYIEHYIRRFGYAKLARLKPKPFYSASVNYGRPLAEVY